MPRKKKKLPIPFKIYKTARRQLIQIWHYTEKTWSEYKADSYIRDLYQAMEDAAGNHHLWRPVVHEGFEGIFFIRYKKHFIFFRQLSQGELGILSILHERMDIPSRLKEIVEEEL